MAGKLYTSYKGFPSFFSGKIMGPEEIEEGMLVVAGVPIDQGIVTARPGARYGPRGIREASMLHRGAYEVSAENTLLDVESGIWRKPVASPPLGDIGDFDINPTNTQETTEIVIDGVADIVKRGGIPVLLGGDHYVAYPGFAGFSKGMSERGGSPRLGYLHIDSHPDFRDVHGVGGKYTHGTQARRLSEDSHISYNNMAWVGLNGSVIDPAQHRIFRSGGMRVTTAKMVREQGPAAIVKSAMEVVAHSVDAVYVTIDIDVVDGSESPGTGAPVFTGITAVEFLEMMDCLASYDIIKAVDICEVAPPLDPTGRTVHLAASGLLGILGPKIFETVEIDLGWRGVRSRNPTKEEKKRGIGEGAPHLHQFLLLGELA